MGPSSWSGELVRGLKPLSRVVLFLALCGLALPLWFAARNTYRFFDGHPAKTEGYVHCEWVRPCRGTWRLPDGQRGSGEIGGLSFAADEEQVTDISLYAGRDWAVTDRSDLLVRAACELAGTAIGTVLVLAIAWNSSYGSGSREEADRS